MKRIKAKTLEEFFESTMGKIAWKRGADLAASNFEKNYPDGQYETRLLSAEFEIPKKGRPQVVFVYQRADGRIQKRIQIDTPAGVAAIIKEYRLLKVGHTGEPSDIHLQNKMLSEGKPTVEIQLTTNREGVQAVSIVHANWNKAIPAEEVFEAAKEFLAPSQAPQPPLEEPNLPPEETNLPAAELEPESSPELPTKEVDLTVGMRVRFKTSDGEETGRVKMILEDEREIIVLHDNGSNAGAKEVIPADSILAILAD